MNSIDFACGCFVSFFAVDGDVRSAIACCADHEKPHQTLTGILGDRYEVAIREKHVPRVIPTLEVQMEDVRRRFPDATLDPSEDGHYRCLRFSVPLPPTTWNSETAVVMFNVPANFPWSQPTEGFFIEDPNFRHQDGSRPFGMSTQTFRGRPATLYWGRVTPLGTSARLLAYASLARLVLWRDPHVLMGQHSTH